MHKQIIANTIADIYRFGAYSLLYTNQILLCEMLYLVDADQLAFCNISSFPNLHPYINTYKTCLELYNIMLKQPHLRGETLFVYCEHFLRKVNYQRRKRRHSYKYCRISAIYCDIKIIEGSLKIYSREYMMLYGCSEDYARNDRKYNLLNQSYSYIVTEEEKRAYEDNKVASENIL